MSKGFLSRIRKAYNTYWVVPLTVFGIGAALATHSIYKGIKQARPPSEIFFEHINHIYEYKHSPISLFLLLHYEGKHGKDFKENKNQVSFEELQRAFLNPITLKRLEELIKKDEANTFTEIPLYVTLDYDKDNMPLLNFYERSTANERNARLLLKHKDNPNFVMDFVKSNEKHYKKLTKIPDTLYNKIISFMDDAYAFSKKTLLPQDVEKIRENLGRELVNFYLLQSDNHVIEDGDTLKDFYWRNFLCMKGKLGTKGKFVGLGHIHLPSVEGPKPSDADLESSQKLRQLVFAKTLDDIILYDIIKGNYNAVTAKGLKILKDTN